LKKIKKILVVIQRSNGDVYLSSSLINNLYIHYDRPEIHLLINEDTYSVAKLLPFIKKIYTFSYSQKKFQRWTQEKRILFNIFKKYDLSINLTASDRSVLYTILAGKKSVSAIEHEKRKSWWKKIFLNHYYFFDNSNHILENNLQPLKFLEINFKISQDPIEVSNVVTANIKKKLKALQVKDFLIFHPSTQYRYKVYPENLRNLLLSNLNELGITIIITGGSSPIDLEIKKQLPSLPNLIDFIGQTSLEEFIALSKLSLAYIGMDTLNMHIAASQNKRIFAIFGPTNLKMWSPWSNQIRNSAVQDKPIQTYGEVTIFQADMPCVACGKAGCNDDHGRSDCLHNISPAYIFSKIKEWHLDPNFKGEIPTMTNEVVNQRQVLLYIVYGEDKAYYDGAIFSFLTFNYWIKDENEIEIVVLTEKPEVFLDYPVKTIPISQKQKKQWSLNGSYHFRIKNRGLAFVMDELNLKEFDKILFLDTDTYFNKSPLPLFSLIQPNQALFYLNEGLIYGRKRFFTYVETLEGKKIEIDGELYELTKKSALWGSLMVGITCNMRQSLDWADKLLLKFFELVPAHTIEPFALSESLLRKYKMVEGKKFVSLYSTSRKKEYCSKILSNFLRENKALSTKEQVFLAQKVKMKRPFYVVLKQRFLS
jgi:heptosyltransferase III